LPSSNKTGLTLLVDSASLIYRAFFSVPDTIRAPDGMHVNAAYGFINMLSRLVSAYDPSHFACAWDDDWRPEWRVELLESYKTHRLDLPESPELDAQMPVIEELLGLAGVAVVGAEGYEAEDVIGALIERPTEPKGRVAIVSGDRDLFQLVRDPDVFVLYPRHGVSDLLVVDEKEITRKYGIPGRRYGDFALLRGDPSDGLPGVKGIGEKTASTLISTHGSLEAVIAAAMSETPAGPLAKVAASLDYIDRAGKVVFITGDAPIGNPDITRPRGPADPKLAKVAKRYALDGPCRRLAAALEGKPAAS
jgi:5'-3' exonuclease